MNNTIFNKGNTKRALLLLLISILNFSCSTPKPQFKGESFKRHTTLSESGYTQQRLDSLTNFLKNNLETTGMLILQDGKILYEYGDTKEVSFTASCRKYIKYAFW